MRGKAPVLAWTGKANNLSLRDSTVARLQDLYAATDPALAKAFAEGLDVERIAGATPASRSMARDGGPVAQTGHHKYPVFIEAAEAATRFLARSSPDCNGNGLPISLFSPWVG